METKILQMNFNSGKLEPVKDAILEVGQIIWLNGYGQSKYEHKRQAVYKVEDNNGRSIIHTVNLDTFEKSRRNAWEVKHESQIFGIGMYYTTGDIATTEEIEKALVIAEQKEIEKAKQQEEARLITEDKVKIGTEVLKKIIPSWAKAAIVAYLRVNESDPMSDYSGYSTERTVILGFSKHTRDLFPELRKAAANFEETKKYSVAPEYTGKPEEREYWTPGDEHREKYSMGSGYYLGDSKYHGWIVQKINIYTTEDFIRRMAVIASDPDNIKCNGLQSDSAEYNKPVEIAGHCEIVDYSDKAIAVKGDTKPIKDQLHEMGGRFNKFLKYNGEQFAGWIFPKTKQTEVLFFLNSLK